MRLDSINLIMLVQIKNLASLAKPYLFGGAV